MVYTEKRPWGSFELFRSNEPCTVKLIYIKKGRRLSLQYHKDRQEYWKIIYGNGTVQIGTKKRAYRKNSTFNVPKRARHRVSAASNTLFLEIATGNFNENDVVRVEDDYGRV